MDSAAEGDFVRPCRSAGNPTARWALTAVTLAMILGARPLTAGAATSGALCTTAPIAAANVNTDCMNDGTTNFETALAVNPTNSENLVGAAMNGQLVAKNNRFEFDSTVRPHVSLDGGQSWTTEPVTFNGYSYTFDPTVAFDGSGTVYLAVAASGHNNPDIVLTRSADGGQTWSATVRVAAGSGSNGSGVYNDHPQLAAYGSGQLVLTWIQSTFGAQGTFLNSPLYDSVSHDGGRTWSMPQNISGSAPFCTGSNGDNACDLAFGNAVAVSPAAVAVSFQDTYQDDPNGDTNVGRNKHMVVKVDPASGALSGGPYLVGQAYDGINEHDFPVDARGLQTLQDSQLNLDLDGNIAADPTNPLHFGVVWYDDRNAPHPVSADPYQAATNSDIIVSQTLDGGQTWSAPAALTTANDQFMPWAVYDGNGRLRVGYYDRSYDAGNRAYGYTVATETGKATLRFATLQVTTALSDPTEGALQGITVNGAYPNAAPGIGDYTAVAVTPTSIDAYWTDMRGVLCTNGRCGSTEDAIFASVPLH